MDISSIIQDTTDVLRYIKGNRILLDLVYTAIILIILYIVVKVNEKLFLGLYKRGLITEKAAEKISKSIDLVVYILAFIGIIYVFTQAQELTILVIALIIIGVIASWDVLVNLIGYYSIMIYRIVETGSFIEIGEVKGRVREVTMLYTVVESDGNVYRVPNKEFLRNPFRLRGEAVEVCVKFKLLHEGDFGKLQIMEKNLLKGIEARLGEFLVLPEEKKARLVPVKYTSEYGEYVLSLKMQGPKLDPYRMGQLVKAMSTIMTAANINGEVSVTECDKPNP